MQLGQQTVLIREVSLIQSVFYREFPLYTGHESAHEAQESLQTYTPTRGSVETFGSLSSSKINFRVSSIVKYLKERHHHITNQHSLPALY